MKVLATKAEIKITLIALVWSAPTIVLTLAFACAQVGIL
jgi:hypothetical protein